MGRSRLAVHNFFFKILVDGIPMLQEGTFVGRLFPLPHEGEARRGSGPKEYCA